MLILGIDTSAKTASVAVSNENTVLAQTTVLTNLTHSQVILPLVKKLLSDAELTLADIDCLAVANGPGSYTGLRIGIAGVKGICTGLEKRCIGISTLEALAWNVACAEADIFAVMKARNAIAYFGHYRSDGACVTRVSDDRVCPIEEIAEVASEVNGSIILVGDYASELKSELFADCDKIRVAPPAQRLQLASSLCAVAFNRRDEFIPPEQLDASYLQATKAEKDRKYR